MAGFEVSIYGRFWVSTEAQSEGAAQVGWAPEQLSPAKFYPKVATATYLYLHGQQWEREIRTRSRHLHLRLVGGRRRWAGPRRSPCKSNTEPTTAARAGFVPRAVTGSRSLTCAVVDVSRSYLSGDDPKAYSRCSQDERVCTPSIGAGRSRRPKVSICLSLERDAAEQVALRTPKGTTSGLAQTHRASRDRVEDRLRIGLGLTDRPEDLAGGGLLLERLAQALRQVFDFLTQVRIRRVRRATC